METTEIPEIPHPRRILLLSPPEISTELLTKIFSSSSSSQPITSPTTTSHTTPPPALPQTYQILTPYYRATIPLWQDTISAPDTWSQEWLSLPGASDVVENIGAWILTFLPPTVHIDFEAITLLLETVAHVIQHHMKTDFAAEETLLLAVMMTEGGDEGKRRRLDVGGEEWEDLCREKGGWEFIDGGVVEGGKNEFGEKTGLPRLHEALSSADWATPLSNDLSTNPDVSLASILEDIGLGDLGEMEDDEDGYDSDDDEEEKGGEMGLAPDITVAGIEEGEMSVPILGARRRKRKGRGRLAGQGVAMGTGDGDGEGEEDANDEQVRELENMMAKMQAVKDMSADMPASQRKRFAAKAIQDIMKTL